MVEEKNIAQVKTARWVKVLLVISLGLNMLVVGAIGGMMFSHKADGPPPSLRDITYGPYSRALSREDRRKIAAAMRRDAGSFQQNLPKIRETYRALLAALQADDYDKATVHKLIQAQQEMGLKRQKIGLRLLLERLDLMTAEERQQFAHRLQRALRRLSD